jgi:hypothetical protein
MSPPDICITWSVLSFLGTDPLAQVEVAPQLPHYFWRRRQHFYRWWELLRPIIFWGFIKNLLRWTTKYQVYRDADAHCMPHTRSCSAQTRAWPWSTMPLCLVAFPSFLRLLSDYWVLRVLVAVDFLVLHTQQLVTIELGTYVTYVHQKCWEWFLGFLKVVLSIAMVDWS